MTIQQQHSTSDAMERALQASPEALAATNDAAAMLARLGAAAPAESKRRGRTVTVSFDDAWRAFGDAVVASVWSNRKPLALANDPSGAPLTDNTYTTGSGTRKRKVAKSGTCASFAAALREAAERKNVPTRGKGGLAIRWISPDSTNALGEPHPNAGKLIVAIITKDVKRSPKVKAGTPSPAVAPAVHAASAAATDTKPRA